MSLRKNPLVSVVIPLYNQKQYVAQAIGSILAQSYEAIEIVVINDGSIDEPQSVLAPFGDKIIVVNQENQGLAAARNAGIAVSQGEYLQFLDADDLLHPEKIKLQMAFHKQNRASLSYCEILQYNQDSEQSTLGYVGPIDDMFAHLYNFWHTYPLPVHAVLMTRELFDSYGPFETDLTACEDRYFFSRLAAAREQFLYFPFIGGKRRIHGANMNRDRSHIIANIVKYYNRINEKLGHDFFTRSYGSTGSQLLAANLTYIYRGEIARGQRRSQLKWVRELMKKQGIQFCSQPIPGETGSVCKMFLKAYLFRWRKKLKL